MKDELKKSGRIEDEWITKKKKKKVTNCLAISMTNLKFMQIFYQLHGLLYFVTHVVNIFMFCYIYENWPIYIYLHHSSLSN